MNVKYTKLHPDAHAPKKAHESDAAFDLYATSVSNDNRHHATVYGTGLAFEIPAGHAMFVYPRSSSYKHAALMTNSVGVIDSGYRGEVHVMFRGIRCKYKVGERIAQAIIMPIPDVEYTEADSLAPSDRGENGIGSTGTR